MRYKVYQNGQLCKVMAKKNNSSMRYKTYMYKQQGIDWSLIEDYLFDGHMDDVSVAWSGNNIIVTFTPVPENVANEIVKAKTFRFGILRHRAHASSHSSYSNRHFTYYDFNTEKYRDTYAGIYHDYYKVSIPNDNRINYAVTKEELRSGRLIRAIKQVVSGWTCCIHTYQSHPDYFEDLYIGFIYWGRNGHSSPEYFYMDNITY